MEQTEWELTEDELRQIKEIRVKEAGMKGMVDIIRSLIANDEIIAIEFWRKLKKRLNMDDSIILFVNEETGKAWIKKENVGK